MQNNMAIIARRIPDLKVIRDSLFLKSTCSREGEKRMKAKERGEVREKEEKTQEKRGEKSEMEHKRV
jgi:hypothetical protein